MPYIFDPFILIYLVFNNFSILPNSSVFISNIIIEKILT
jgi:hypothetical protein